MIGLSSNSQSSPAVTCLIMSSLEPAHYNPQFLARCVTSYDNSQNAKKPSNPFSKPVTKMINFIISFIKHSLVSLSEYMPCPNVLKSSIAVCFSLSILKYQVSRLYWSVVVKLSVCWSIYIPTLSYDHRLWVVTKRTAQARVSSASGCNPMSKQEEEAWPCLIHVL